MLVVLFPCVVQAASPAPPPEAASDRLTEQARRRFDEGVRAYAEEDYERARVAFLQTLALKPLPEVLLNLGLAEVQGGHNLNGARHLAEYLRGRPATTESAESRAAAIRLLGQAERHVARLWFTVEPENATVKVDRAEVGPFSNGHLFWYVEPGTHEVVVSSADRTYAEKVYAARGRVIPVRVSLGRIAPRSELEPSSSSRGAIPDRFDPTLPAVLTATSATLSLLSAAAWVGFALDGFSLERDADQQLAVARERYGAQACGGSSSESSACRELAETLDRADQSHGIANVAAGATVFFSVATAAAFAFWLGSDRETSERVRADLRPWAAWHSGGLEAKVLF